MRAVLLCVGVSALSLVAQRTPDFDPTAWLIWGRQVAEGTLHTTGGPSWKPLPVLFTTPFAFAGDTVAPWLWLVVARTGGLVALVLAFRLAARLAGRTAGWLAAAGLALATDFLWNAARGDAEGLLVTFTFGAVLLHLDGRRHGALLAGVGAGLVRPEAWPFLAAYGMWLAWRERSARTAALVALSGSATVALWFVPEYVGSGDWFRAATRAQHPVDGSPGQSAFPFLMVFVNSAVALSLPVYAGAVRAALDAWRRRHAVLLAIAGASCVLMVIVGLLAEQGFTGNLRYVTLPAALVCVLGGVGLPMLHADLLRARPVVRGVAWGLAAAGVAFSAGLLVRNAAQLAEEGRVYGRELPEVIARAGGADAVTACGTVGASHFERQAVAYRLDILQEDVKTAITIREGIAFAREGTGGAEDTPMPVRLRHGDWVVRATCPIG